MALVHNQRGVVTRQQLYELGVSPRTLSRRVADGVWIPHRRDVLQMRTAPDDLATRSRIAARRFPHGILTGVSVAALHARGPWDGVALGRRPWIIATARPIPSIRFLAQPGAGHRVVEGLRMATPEVALVDAIRLLPPDDARRLAYRTVQTHALSIPSLIAASERLRRCAGSRQLQGIIDDLTTGAHAESERLLVDLVSRAGISGWRANQPISLPGRTVAGDLVFPDSRLVVEVDGRSWHSDSRRFQRDRTRQNALVRGGWIVRRFTWEDLTRRPQQVVREIREWLAEHGGPTPG